jgi:uncharacterized protein YaaW (UPF0174 family)
MPRTIRTGLSPPGYAQRLSEVQGILCGTAQSVGLVHAVAQTAESLERLTEAHEQLAKQVVDSSLRTEQMIRDLTAQVQMIASSGALQGTQLKAIQDERDAAKNKMLQVLLQGAGSILIRILVVVFGSVAVVWSYLQMGFGKSTH